MQRLTLIAFAALSLASSACDNRLTPELVRDFLDVPTGNVTNETMARASKDLFLSERATQLESFANIIKVDKIIGGDGGPSSGAEALGDAFCVTGAATNVSQFDACGLGDNCEAELVLDSCLLRVLDGDEDARGKIKLKLANELDAGFQRSSLAIDFDGWESSRDDALLDTFTGAIALETNVAVEDLNVDVVFASDLDINVKRKAREMFDDGIEEHTNISAGLRFNAIQNEESATGSLEVLAFVDENGDRKESVSIKMAAESHIIDVDGVASSASLQVVGGNGTFECTWGATSTDADRDGARVTSEGECIDENGESFVFSGEVFSD